MMPRIPSRAVEGLLYALTAFGVFAFGGVEPWSRAVLEVLALLLALAVILKGRPAGSPAGSYSWLFPAAVAALGYGQLSTTTAPGDPIPLRPFTSTPDETRAAVMLWVAYAAVLWSVPRIIVTHEAARRYARFVFGVGVALAALGLLQEATGGHHLYFLRYAPQAHTFGSYYNRDHAANILLMTAAMGIGLLISRFRKNTERVEMSFRRPSVLDSAALLVIIIGLVVCSSEAAFLAVPLGGSFVLFLGADLERSAYRRRLRAGVAIAGAVMTVFFAYHHVLVNAEALGFVESSVLGRLTIYNDALRWFQDAPLFGVGLGGFETIYPSYQDYALRGSASHAHSDWVEFTLETGVLGLVGAMGAAGLMTYCTARTWREARSAEMRCLVGGGLAAAAVFAGHGLFDFSFQIPGNAIMFFTVLGFLLSAPSWADKSGSRPEERPPSYGAVLLAVAYCLLLIRTAVMPAVAAWRADERGEPLDRVVALAEAISLDETPKYAARLAAVSFMAAGDGVARDYALIRLSLRYALAAAERRPFSAEVLYLTGTILQRLERPKDSGDYFSRAGKVAFSPFVPKRSPSARGGRRKR